MGEDLTCFRDESKNNYGFLRSFSWNDRAERLGFDEVFIDCTDLVEFNIEILNHNDLQNSFFHLQRDDPEDGFSFDASTFSGQTLPPHGQDPTTCGEKDPADLGLRLRLGSHLAEHMRNALDSQHGYTSTVGISTNKLLAKLVGNVNKPKGQTTLLPPYSPNACQESNAQNFLDAHDIGKIPGIGFKTAQKLRTFILGRPADFDTGLVYGGTRENVFVRDVRLSHGMGIGCLQRVVGHIPKNLPERVWNLINAVDDSDVGKARDVPHQISIVSNFPTHI